MSESMRAAPEELEAQAFRAYDRFQPGTADRALRTANAAKGLRTCAQCLAGYRPHTDWAISRWPGSLGRGRFFCTWRCYVDWLRGQQQRRPVPEREAIVAECWAAHDALRRYLAANS